MRSHKKKQENTFKHKKIENEMKAAKNIRIYDYLLNVRLKSHERRANGFMGKKVKGQQKGEFHKNLLKLYLK